MSAKSLILSRYLWPHAGCVQGPKIAEYERGFAEATESKYAVGFWKGRLAFFAALKALGITEGDEIIMPGYTCMVVPAAAMQLGAKCVYVDIEPQYCTLNPDNLQTALTPRTKAIMIQHTYGWPNAGLDRIVDWANRHGLALIEDCCHALGTRYRGKHMGNFGVAGFFSSQWSKPFTTGIGGMLVCNDGDFYRRVMHIRETEAQAPAPKTAAQLALQGIVYDLLVYPKTMALAQNTYRWLTRKKIVTGSTCQSEYTAHPKNYFQRMCEVQAAAGLYELKRLDRTLDHRRKLNQWYIDALQGAGWPVPSQPDDSEVALLRFPVRVSNKTELLKAADRHLVELGDWFVRPLHSNLAPQEPFGYHTGMCPEAEKAAREMINLPTHLRVSSKLANNIIRFIQQYGITT
ncbi:MAG: DegT/DnrJ/EryC1/StrS family aminotransferase [Planctomycetota bacterium]|jgi:dTDP-4-amino-4,6-dideoxygalactose transaminase